MYSLSRWPVESRNSEFLYKMKKRRILKKDEYKYLAVIEVCDIKIKKRRKTVTKEYNRRLKPLLKSKLNG